MIGERPIVSIRLMVYNNEDYIRDTIEGILIQKVNFPVEVVVGDDFSTDKTLTIIKSYSNTDFIKFKILDREIGDSYWLKRQELGRLYNFVDIVNNCDGKYVAFCDGDDYWTDPFKLQKQVDFLEKNPDFSLCFHRANLLREDSNPSLHPIPEISTSGEYTYANLLQHNNFITTASVLFRKSEEFEFPKWFLKIPFGDLALYQLVSKKGIFKCLNEVMSVYRIHSEGIYSKLPSIKKKEQHLTFYLIMYPFLNQEEQDIVMKKHNKQIEIISKQKYPESKWMRFGYNRYLKLKYAL